MPFININTSQNKFRSTALAIRCKEDGQVQPPGCGMEEDLSMLTISSVYTTPAGRREREQADTHTHTHTRAHTHTHTHTQFAGRITGR